jgi:hypothetical protein
VGRRRAGDARRTDESEPAGYSASVGGLGGDSGAAGAAAGNWANRSAAASADPALWDQARDQDAARHARTTASRRLGRLVVASMAERLEVPRARLREALRAVGGAVRPARSGRAASARPAGTGSPRSSAASWGARAPRCCAPPGPSSTPA